MMELENNNIIESIRNLYFPWEIDKEIDENDEKIKNILLFKIYFKTKGSHLIQHIDIYDEDIHTIYINYQELYNCPPFSDFIIEFQQNSEEYEHCLGAALSMIRYSKISFSSFNEKIQIRFNNYFPIITSYGTIKSNLINQFISITGTVIRVGPINPFVIKMDFICGICETINIIYFIDGKYQEPTTCNFYSCKNRYNFIPNRSTAVTCDYQKIRIQEIETLDDKAGKIPRTIEIELMDDLVGTCIPADRVNVCGVIKGMNHDIKSRKNAQTNSLYILYMKANSIETTRNFIMEDEGIEVPFTDDELVEFENLKKEEDLFSHLVHSLCPGIYGNEIVKASLLLVIFGGTKKESSRDNYNQIGKNKEKSSPSSRTDSHLLIVGDPGLGKSQMLNAVYTCSPRAIYVSGNSVTTTGLTINLKKDTCGEYALEAGAVVLADQGICLIDEFDKIGADSDVLLETMEQQSISIAKAGIVSTFNARTSIIAAANPIEGHYNKKKTISQNLKIKPSLLSRFDLVFVLVDHPDEERDLLVSNHIMKIHSSNDMFTNENKISWQNVQTKENNSNMLKKPLRQRLRDNAYQFIHYPISPLLLRKYISYTKAYIKPKLSFEAIQLLKKMYLKMRKTRGDNYNEKSIDYTTIDSIGCYNSNNANNDMPITIRQLESLIRLAQARAKIECSEIVSIKHAEDVIEIFQESLLDVKNYETEDYFSFSKNSSKGLSLNKKKKYYLKRLMNEVKVQNKKLFSYTELLELAESMKLSIDNFGDFLDLLNHECYILKKPNQMFQVQVSVSVP